MQFIISYLISSVSILYFLTGHWVPLYQSFDPGEGNSGEIFLPLISGDFDSPLATPTPSAMPEQMSRAAPLVATIRFGRVNLRAGPNMSYSPIVQVRQGQTCEVTGRNEDATWGFVYCMGGAIGWIDMRLAQVEGDIRDVPVIQSAQYTPTPTVTPTSLPTATFTPTPDLFNKWKASYFNNADLEGNPVAIEGVNDINFNWGAGTPHMAIPSDRFSIRFERSYILSSGYYQFSVDVDDGVRVFLNDQLLINEWHGARGGPYNAVQKLNAGLYNLRVEYFESVGNARIRFSHELAGDSTEWIARYYPNRHLQGEPAFVRQEPRREPPLNYNWGNGSPNATLLPADNWSAVWTGTFQFESGNYIFQTLSDDGVRVFIDDTEIINGWQDGMRTRSNTFYGIGRGEHTIRVEYYEHFGDARLRVWWFLDSTNQLE